MQKDSKGKCETASHQNLKEKTKSRVDDLQRMFLNLESARKDSRANDVAVLEEQVNQMLREWKVELSEPSPASSLLGGSLGSFSEELARLLHEHDVEDDATSPLGELTLPKPKPDPDPEIFHAGNFTFAQIRSISGPYIQDLFDAKEPQDQSFQGFFEAKGTFDFHDMVANESHFSTPLEDHQFDLHQDFSEGHIVGTVSKGQYEQDVLTEVLPDISPPPAAFLGPKCALWDCSRPAQGSNWCQDYCSSCHAVLALNEGLPGITPVLRPSGVDIKDGPLFSALDLKTKGKEVGIPNCEGAAFTKCPWNAPDLFDLSLLEGEKIREWLFFDKPRRAFESGNRKQRSLPDYSGRGWHESRKQIMKEFGGQKRSYYMDPQPSKFHEWHLYEYDITNYSTCALYRLELKLVDEKKSPKGKVDGKKSPKGNMSNDSLADLQKKMGRLTAEAPGDDTSASGGSAERNRRADAYDISSAHLQVTSTPEL